MPATILSLDNIIVHALWIGKQLSSLEMLTLKSFVAHGHTFYLWIYEPLAHTVPKGVICQDATQIIPREQIFTYQYQNKFGHGKGSYAGFSDIFRYRLLYLQGGWWVDMDVCCLQPLNIAAPYVFRTHHKLPVVGNILKCPPNSPLMLQCYEAAIQKIDAQNIDWMLPIQILNDHIKALGLSHYIIPLSNRDSWYDIRNLLRFALPTKKNWYAIHWNNEELGKNNIDKNAVALGSALHLLHTIYDNKVQVLQKKSKWLYWWKLTIPYYVFNRLLKIW